MGLTLSSAIAQAKNMLSDPGAWLVLLEIDTPALEDPLRLVRNTEDITWDGETWTAFPFDLDESKQDADGSIQTLAIRVSNVQRQVEKYVNDADGGSNTTVTLRVVYSEELDEDAVLEEIFTVGTVRCTNDWVTFELEPEAFLTQRFPRDTFNRTRCRWNFKSRECGYTGTTYSSCNNVLADCILRDRVSSFGGTPGLPDGSNEEAGIIGSTAE